MPPLLTKGNSNLGRDQVWVWTLPAWVVQLPDGTLFNPCPAAGACAALCYARQGTFNFSNVKQAHLAKLLMVKDDLPQWELQMDAELGLQKFRGAYVRIHDSGDFFSDEYLAAWLRIIESHPETTFYCYTKEVRRFRRMEAAGVPENFKYVFSFGGREDHLIDRERDRHADVFANEDAITAAGYTSQSASDLIAIQAPSNKIGIVANGHRHLQKKQGEHTFGDIQADRALHAQVSAGTKARDYTPKPPEPQPDGRKELPLIDPPPSEDLKPQRVRNIRGRGTYVSPYQGAIDLTVPSDFGL